MFLTFCIFHAQQGLKIYFEHTTWRCPQTDVTTNCTSSSRTKNRHYSLENPIYRRRVRCFRYFAIPDFSVQKFKNVTKDSNSDIFKATVHKLARWRIVWTSNPIFCIMFRYIGKFQSSRSTLLQAAHKPTSALASAKLLT